MGSILTSIKKLLGIAENYTHFDDDIIMHINSVFMTLHQLGVGPAAGFYIVDKSTEWSEYVSNPAEFQAVKTYMYLKVKLVFDPSSIGSSTLASYERTIQELEWRLNVMAETKKTTAPEDNTPEDNTPEDDTPVYDAFVAVLGSASLGTMKLGYTGG